MYTELVLAAIGVVLSLLVSFCKPIAKWFYNIKEDYRGLAMLGLGVISAGGVFGLSCLGLFNFVSCTATDAVELLRSIFILMVSNQLTYQLSPESPIKLEIKAQIAP